MPKRKAEESETDYLKRKLRKLQKRLNKLPSEPVHPPTVTTTPPTVITTPPTPRSPIHPSPLTPPVFRENLNKTLLENHHDEENIENLVQEDEVLPEEFLLALGTEGEESEVRGPEIRAELASRWTTIMATGLGKDTKEKIVQKYPAPANFFKAPPKINPEIMASLSEVSQKRDNRILYRQTLILTAMAALGKTLTNVLKGNINSNTIIEEVNDAAKILAEVYFEDSSSRKFFALAGANTIIKEAVRDSRPDEFLFGKDCPDKIKAAQAIKKTGSQIKNPEPSTNTKQPAAKQQPQQKRQGNWKAPSRQYQQYQQRARGGHRQPQQRKYNHQREQKHRQQHRSRHTYRR